MNTVTINGRDILVPSSWNELSRDQLVYISGLFSKKLTATQFKCWIAWKLINLSRGILDYIDPEDAHGVISLMGWVLEEVKLTRNLLPRIGRYYGPADDMKDCSFGEFTKAQMKVEDYARTGDEKDLDELVAILYREKRWFWWIIKRFTDSADCRVRFVEKFLAARTKKMGRRDHAEKYAVFLMVNGVMASLPEKFPNLYRHRSGKEKDGGGWATVILTLSDGKTDDESLNRIFYSNMYNVFMGLEQKAAQYFEDLKNLQRND